MEAEERPPEVAQVPLEICSKPIVFGPCRGPVAAALIERLGLCRQRLLRSQEQKGRAWMQVSYPRVRPTTQLFSTTREACPSTEPLLTSRLPWRQHFVFKVLSWRDSHPLGLVWSIFRVSLICEMWHGSGGGGPPGPPCPPECRACGFCSGCCHPGAPDLLPTGVKGRS